MEVVFTQDVPNKARAGEVRRVPDGYARNYLLPQGLAEIATPEVLKRLHKITAVGDEVRVRETAVMEELARVIAVTAISSGVVLPKCCGDLHVTHLVPPIHVYIAVTMLRTVS